MQGQTGYAIRTVVGLEDPESLSTVVAFSEDGDPSSRADGGQAGEKQLAGQVKRGKWTPCLAQWLNIGCAKLNNKHSCFSHS